MNSKTPLLGIVFAFIYVLMASIKPLLVGEALNDVNSYLLVLLLFIPTWLLFVGLQWKQWSAFIAKARGELANIAWTNVATAIAWLGFFLALELGIPAHMEVFIAFSAVPIGTVLFTKWLLPDKPKSFEWMTAGALLVVMVILSFQFDTELPLGQKIMGLFLAASSGLALSAHFIYSNKLYKKGFSASEVLAVRFPLLLAICAIVVIYQGSFLSTGLEHLTWYLVVVLILFTILPLLMLQLSLKHIRPVDVAVISATLPLFTLTGEWVKEPSKIPGVASALWILIGVAILLYSAFVRRRWSK